MKRIIRWLLAIVALFLSVFLLLAHWLTHETVTGVERWRYDKDLVLTHVTTSSGGALGNETDRVSWRYQGDEGIFFEGVRGSEFALRRQGKALAITFCNGWISAAHSIWLGEPRNERIPLRLKLDCGDDPKTGARSPAAD